MIYLQKPQNFNSKFNIVGCICDYNGKILVLLRQDHKPQGNQYGIPSGKIDDGETPLNAVVRELYEETNIQASEEKFKHIKDVLLNIRSMILFI